MYTVVDDLLIPCGLSDRAWLAEYNTNNELVS